MTFNTSRLIIAAAFIGPIAIATSAASFAAPVSSDSVTIAAAEPAAMNKIFLVRATGTTPTTSVARQTLVAQADLPPLEPPRDQLINRNNLTATGATVPHPGVPQIGAESKQEIGAEQRSDRDTQMICSNCD